MLGFQLLCAFFLCRIALAKGFIRMLQGFRVWVFETMRGFRASGFFHGFWAPLGVVRKRLTVYRIRRSKLIDQAG